MTTVDPLEQQREIDLLRSENEKLRRMAMIGELASTTTHEFNNLMMTILNFAQMGQRNQEAAARDKAFDRILKAAEKATKVTGTVLAMSRGRSASKEPTLLKSLVEDTIVLLEREYRKYRVHLELNLQETSAVDGMADELQRLIVNLLVNARQATPEGGQVRVSLVQEDAFVRLSVRDNGSGIAPDVLPRIFDPFFSTKSGPDESGKGGTGVGLASCKEIIEAHEGHIRVESSLGKGTDFIIRFPVSQQTTESAKAG